MKGFSNKILGKLNELRNTQDYYFTLLNEYQSASNTAVPVHLNLFIDEFIDNGEEKNYYSAGFSCGYVLRHLFDVEVTASD